MCMAVLIYFFHKNQIGQPPNSPRLSVSGILVCSNRHIHAAIAALDCVIATISLMLRNL